MPSFAMAPVPLTTPEQCSLAELIRIRTPLTLPVTTPVVALYEVTFTCQGRATGVRTGAGGRPRPHCGKLARAIEPMPVPDSPLPPLSVPFICADGQVVSTSVVVSFRVTFPDVSETGPPGRTVHVVAATAMAVPRVAVRTAAQP